MTFIPPSASRLRRFLRFLTARSGAMDLPSIMIGVAVVAILSVGVTATVYGAIPWAQNHSAKQNITAVRTAEGMAANSHGSFLDAAALKKAGYLESTAGLGIATNGKPGDKGCFVTVMQSKSGKMYYGSDTMAEAAELKSGTKDPCVLGSQLQDAISEAGGKILAGTDTYTVTRAGGGDARVSGLPTAFTRTHENVTGLAGKTITELASGTQHSCAIANNEPWCWGSQVSYRLGNKVATGITAGAVKASTASLPAGQKLHSLSSYYATTCLIAAEKLYCWGNNDAGQIDASVPGSASNYAEPKLVPGMADKQVTAVSTGRSNTCAVSEGSLYCWGKNSWGVNGTGINDGATPSYHTPRKVGGVLANKTVTSVMVGQYNACAVADGSLYCWGSSTMGQLPTAGVTSAVPVKIAGLPKGRTVGDVAIGNTSICAVVDTSLWCWGLNGNGEIGNGTLTTVKKPSMVKGALQGKTVESVSMGKGVTCAIASDDAYCWGANAYGQTGTGGEADLTLPVKVANPQKTVFLEVGEFASTAATIPR